MPRGISEKIAFIFEHAFRLQSRNNHLTMYDRASVLHPFVDSATFYAAAFQLPPYFLDADGNGGFVARRS